MVDQAELLPAISADPDNDELRLVYADWLEERGDPLGEFIRVQIELVHTAESHVRFRHLKEREKQLQAALWHRLRPPLLAGMEWGPATRGFVEKVTVQHWWGYMTHGSRLFELAPLRWLRFSGFSIRPAHLADLARPLAGRLPLKVEFLRNGLGPMGAQALADVPALAQVRELSIFSNRIGDDGIAALAASPHVAGLTWLNLWANQIGDRGAAAIARAPGLAALQHLILSGNAIGDDGARQLAASTQLERLVKLELRGNAIGKAGQELLVARFGAKVQLD